MDIRDRQIANRKAEIVTYNQIVAVKDLEIGGLRNAKDILVRQYYESEKVLKKAKRKAWFNGLWEGVLIGGGAAAALLIVLP